MFFYCDKVIVEIHVGEFTRVLCFFRHERKKLIRRDIHRLSKSVKISFISEGIIVLGIELRLIKGLFLILVSHSEGYS